MAFALEEVVDLWSWTTRRLARWHHPGATRSKTSRPLVLPLTSAIGRALVAYLRRGRPGTDRPPDLRLPQWHAPSRFRKSSNVYRIVRLAFDRARIRSARRGPHVPPTCSGRHTSSSADSPSRSLVTCSGISIPIQLCRIRNSRSRISEKSLTRSPGDRLVSPPAGSFLAGPLACDFEAFLAFRPGPRHLP